MTLPPAVIGASAQGPFAIDIVRDGPHALIGGTTGSGKSELLQTIVASLALAAPPSRVTFLLIDYKGGAAFRQCVALPHTVGFLTDLDHHLAKRALASLEAEIRYRESILAAHAARDLDRLWRARPDVAPPRLLIVIDEFATLSREVPEFIEGVVDIAQRGRSLGIHLILATQRPAGVVTPAIRANTNLRIALRMSDPIESEDVIGNPAAAFISRDAPGRAYARIGHSEVVEFQAAYVGGRTTATPSTQVTVRPFELGHVADELVPRAHSAATQADADGDLSQIVRTLTQAASLMGLERPRPPWLAPLASLLPIATVDPAPPAGTAVIGMVDDPGRQEQRPLTLNLEHDGGLLVYGTGGSGKSNALRVIAGSLASHMSPADLNVYGLDFGAGGLRLLEALPHTGAVISGTDEERVTRLLRGLRSETARRQELLGSRGVFTLSEYLALDGDRLPRIVLLLDGYESFTSVYERVAYGENLEAIPRLMAEGRAVGVHLVIAADRRGSIPGRLAGATARRLVLRLADPAEYAYLGIPRDAVRDRELPAGRGFNEDGLEVQCAILGVDSAPAMQAAALQAIAEQAATATSDRAPGVEVLPARIDATELPAPSQPLRAVIGIGDAAVAPLELDLADAGLLITGPYRSGRSTALRAIVSSVRRGGELRTMLLAPRATPVADLDGWEQIASGAEECALLAGRLAQSLGSRDRAATCLVVIDDGEELADGPLGDDLLALVRRGRAAGVHIIAAAELKSAARAFTGWLPELRKERHGLILQPGPDTTGDVLGVALPRAGGRALPPGRGYYVQRGTVELVQVATA